MPVALITLHRYASWMPDHPKGFVHRIRGLCETDERLARFYRANQAEPPRHFDAEVQLVLLRTLFVAAECLGLTLHAVASESSHLHILCAWRDGRSGQQLQRSLKYAMTRALNQSVQHRRWFSRGGQVKPVHDLDHLNHLKDIYLPSHSGLKWTPERGVW